MAKFDLNSGLISKATSTITGSLIVSGQITASHFGTSSYVVTASYANNSGVTSYTLATSISSASYATTAISASVSLTASIMLNPSYGPTPGIGWISPNISMLSALAGTTYLYSTSSANLGGTLLFPFMVNKDCTLVTMSVLGGVSNNTTCSLGIYSNSLTTSLPEYLLVTGSIRVTAANTAVLVYNASNFTPLKMFANTVYWVAQTSNALVANYAFRPAILASNTAPSYNPLLGYALVASGSGSPANFMYPMWCLRSGSFTTTFAPTASQLTTSYFPPTGAWGPFGFINQITAPYLRVTYP